MTDLPQTRKWASLPFLSLDYAIALLPIIAWSIYLNGTRTILLALLGILCGAIWDVILEAIFRRRITAWDGSGAMEGLIFALMLPVTAPLPIIPIGTLAGALLFKALWGGQGKCPIHPAVGAYALLFPFFRTVLTTYAAPFERFGMLTTVEGSLGKDLLASLAAGGAPSSEVVADMLVGKISGGMGHISIILLIGSLAFLALRGHARPLQPIFTAVSAFAIFILLPATVPASDAMALRYAVLQLGCGSLLYLSIIPATHPAYAPKTFRGGMIFAIGVGVITGLLRYAGLAVDGAVYGVLVMQCLTPFLDRAMRGRWYAKN